MTIQPLTGELLEVHNAEVAKVSGLANKVAEAKAMLLTQRCPKCGGPVVLHDTTCYSHETCWRPMPGTRAATQPTFFCACKDHFCWMGPGSGNPLYTFKDVDADTAHVYPAYKDTEGREWGYIPYFCGSRHIWICLSDPVNRDIPAFNPAPEPILWSPNAAPDWYGTSPAQPPVTPVKEPGMAPIMIVIIIILAAIAAVLVIKFRKPKKTTP